MDRERLYDVLDENGDIVIRGLIYDEYKHVMYEDYGIDIEELEEIED